MTTLLLEEWYHIAGVISNFDEMNICVNGIIDNEGFMGFADNIAYSNSGKAVLGRKDSSLTNPDSFLGGCIDDIKFFRTALDAEDIWKEYNEIPITNDVFTN